MDETFRLGRIGGIAVGVNWSVVIVAGLIAWGLATETYPLLVPDQSPTAYWIAAVVTALVFFASLLAHELGHSFVARRHGVQVQAITLWMLGGVAKLEGEARSADDELRITVVGPLVSVTIGAIFGVLGAVMALLGARDLFVAVPVWLATINVVLAVFNLIPAFPLDGGRVLRALLWRHTGDQLAATRSAATVGRYFGYGFVAFGVFMALSGAPTGLWFALIGAFVIFASGLEATQLEQKALLTGVSAADVMTPNPITAPAWVTVQEAIDRHVLTHHVSAFPLLAPDGHVVGLTTLTHLRTVPPAARAATPVTAVAEPIERVPLVAPDAPLDQVVALLAASPLRRVLVIRDGVLAGIISSTDIVRTMQIRDLARVPTGPGPQGPIRGADDADDQVSVTRP